MQPEAQSEQVRLAPNAAFQRYLGGHPGHQPRSTRRGKTVHVFTPPRTRNPAGKETWHRWRLNIASAITGRRCCLSGEGNCQPSGGTSGRRQTPAVPCCPHEPSFPRQIGGMPNGLIRTTILTCTARAWTFSVHRSRGCRSNQIELARQPTRKVVGASPREGV